MKTNHYLNFLKKLWRFFLDGSVKIIALTLLCVILRLFVFEIYYIPSSSMESTLRKGDYVLVSKLHYGPRWPRNIMEIPIINFYASNFISGKKAKELAASNQPYKRIELFTDIKRGDVIVFNTPVYQSGFSIKRCLWIPKDTLHHFLNSKIRLTEKIFILSDSAGNIIIPSKQTCSSYRNRILEKKFDYLKKRESLKLIKNFYFNDDYLFLQGDNTQHSTDSRSWGLVQKDHVVGKATYILFSYDENKGFLWSRIFKSIK